MYENIIFYTLIITGDGGAVCSEEVLDSHNVNVTKSFVPKLSPSKSDSKGDQDHPDEQQPPKVYGSIISYMVYGLTACGITG